MSKRHFWGLFKPAFDDAFSEKNLESAWRKTGLHPFDPEVVLSQVRYVQLRPPSSSSSAASISIRSWKRASKLFNEAYGVPTTRQEKKVKKTFDAVFHKSLALSTENEVLKAQLDLQKKQGQRSRTLFNELRAKSDNKALFFSPNKIQEAKDLLQSRERAKEEESEQKRRRKAAREEAKHLKQLEVEERRRQREIAKKEKEAQEAERIHVREEERQQRQAEKQLLADRKLAKKRKTRLRAKTVRSQANVDAVVEAQVECDPELAPSRSGRQRRLPQRYCG